MGAAIVACWFAGGIAGVPLALAETADPASPDAFLAALAGDWRGDAVRTPIGVRPYDISFRRTAAGAVQGVAEPGSAQHEWIFAGAEDGLRLRFLSNFRGNRQPFELRAGAPIDGVWRFQAEQPQFLALLVRLSADELRIEVRHDDRPHVEIRLRRGGVPR